MAAFFKIFFSLFIALVLCTEIYAQYGRGRGNGNGFNRGGGGRVGGGGGRIGGGGGLNGGGLRGGGGLNGGGLRGGGGLNGGGLRGGGGGLNGGGLRGGGGGLNGGGLRGGGGGLNGGGGINGGGRITGGGRSFASVSVGRGQGRRYRSILYNDDDVYGYEANYPNGEALYINYKSSEARSKRAPEFARSSPYSRGGGQGFPGQDQGEMGYDAPPDFGLQ